MSKNAILIAVAVCLLLGLAGAGVLGWMWISRDRAAVASYRVDVPINLEMSTVVEKESELMKSDEVLRPLISELDLLDRWKLETEEEALERLRAKLTVKSGALANRVRVVYRDRNQDRALEILNAINKQYGKVRSEAARQDLLPRLVR